VGGSEYVGANAKDPASAADAATVDYHALARNFAFAEIRIDRLLDLPMASVAVQGLSGLTIQRADLPAKLLDGGFVHDLVIAGMLHARVIRGAHASCRLKHADIDSLRALPGVEHLVHQADFLALVGPDEAAIVAAAESARALVSWVLPELATLAPDGDIEALLTSLPAHTSTAVDTGTAVSAPAAATLTRRYSRPYIAHASIGVSCALAQPQTPGHGGDEAVKLTVWSHTQGAHKLRDEIAQVLGLQRVEVRVIHSAGAGCYGHNGADDVAFDAAWLAHVLQRPVRVAWSRADDMCVAPMGSASLVELTAALDDTGSISQWQAQVWSHSHLGRPGWGKGPNLLGAWALWPDAPRPEAADPPLPNGGGLRNAIPYYELPALEVIHHFIPEAPVRVSALRSLGGHANVFAIESFMDELAELAQADPVEFRLRHLKDERAREVVNLAARLCGWPTLRASLVAGEGRGVGFGFGRYKNKSAYCAVAIEVEVGEAVRVTRVWTAVDAGEIVHRDGLLNQIEGGIVQALSWCLKESVRWDAQGITTTGWEDYPILGFDEIPQVEIELIDRPGLPGLGSGELAAGPVAGALANAVAHALGLRPRHLPITPDRLLRLIHAQP
jgi:CO/xanthine dehydrogenase Mo-binding subunit